MVVWAESETENTVDGMVEPTSLPARTGPLAFFLTSDFYMPTSDFLHSNYL